MGGRAKPADQSGLYREPEQPDDADRRHWHGERSGSQGGCHRDCRQRACLTGFAKADRTRSRRCHVFGNQTHRRPGPSSRRSCLRPQRIRARSAAPVHSSHRADHGSVRSLGANQVTRDDDDASRTHECERARGREVS